ncbi:PEGA domain-containing protein [Pedobacter antarcticus]|uniref:PEGA domain-containing protein n=1 Tax=Pedobacter antarcticus TaxID=34086 RepID=UPI00292E3FA4|nr:PEGA domain-containing protein [Pedobacter antarcticus]
MKKILHYSLIAVIAVSSTSCATIFTGTRQNITINSTQPETEVFVNNAYKGKTPAKFKVNKKGKDEVITLKKEGFVSQELKPQKAFNAIAILNLFNPLAWAIDLLTGAVNRVAPNEYTIKLEQAK